MNIFFVIIFGLVIGSFLNVCIFRIPKEESINYPPSHCDNCKTRLKCLDLIPLISYIVFKGRCRYCGAKIDRLYPAVELLNSLLYVIIYLNFGFNILSFKFYILCSILIVISVIDYRTKYIYESTVIAAAVLGIIIILAEYFFAGVDGAQFIMGGAIGFVILQTIRFISGGIGSGDCDIAAVCGIFLGIKGIAATILLSIFIGGFTATLLLALNLKRGKDKIPFVPFISVSAFLTMLYGNTIINFYMRYIIN